jgi:uncharacterized protein
MSTLIKIFQAPWPWYVSGPLIGLMVPLLLIFGNRFFGISSSLRHVCAACFPADIPFFKYAWKKELWNLVFVAGILLGGIITTFIMSPAPTTINSDLKAELAQYGIYGVDYLVPSDIFSMNELFSWRGFLVMVLGGFLVGFGTRYAGGCTSGHSIMGISNLQWPSIIATCCFMIGGFIMANLILPIILHL